MEDVMVLQKSIALIVAGLVLPKNSALKDAVAGRKSPEDMTLPGLGVFIQRVSLIIRLDYFKKKLMLHPEKNLWNCGYV